MPQSIFDRLSLRYESSIYKTEYALKKAKGNFLNWNYCKLTLSFKQAVYRPKWQQKSSI